MLQKTCFTTPAAAAATVLWPPGLSGTTGMNWYQKCKTNLDLLEQEIVSGSGMRWAMCIYTPCPRWNNHASIPQLSFL